MLSNQYEQTEKIDYAGEKIALSVNDAMDKSMDKLIDTYAVACEGLEEAQIKGMDVLVEKFTSRVTESISEKLTELALMVEETGEYQKSITSQVKNNIELISDISDKTVRMFENTEKALTLCGNYVERMDETGRLLDERIEGLSDCVERSITSTTYANDSGIAKLTECISESIEAFSSSSASEIMKMKKAEFSVEKKSVSSKS